MLPFFTQASNDRLWPISGLGVREAGREKQSEFTEKQCKWKGSNSSKAVKWHSVTIICWSPEGKWIADGEYLFLGGQVGEKNNLTFMILSLRELLVKLVMTLDFPWVVRNFNQ